MPKILIATADALSRKSFSRLLIERGHQVIEAADGRGTLCLMSLDRAGAVGAARGLNRAC